MKDFLGNELGLLDEVVFTAPKYRMFAKGKIIAFTKTKVRVEYMNTWNFAAPGWKDEYLAEPSFLILSKKFECPDVKHESHKSVRSSDASTFDFICDDCGATDDVTGGWGTLRKPCKEQMMYRYDADTGDYPKLGDRVKTVRSGADADGIVGVIGGWLDTALPTALLALEEPMVDGRTIVCWPVVCLQKTVSKEFEQKWAPFTEPDWHPTKKPIGIQMPCNDTF